MRVLLCLVALTAILASAQTGCTVDNDSYESNTGTCNGNDVKLSCTDNTDPNAPPEINCVPNPNCVNTIKSLLLTVNEMTCTEDSSTNPTTSAQPSCTLNVNSYKPNNNMCNANEVKLLCTNEAQNSSAPLEVNCVPDTNCATTITSQLLQDGMTCTMIPPTQQMPDGILQYPNGYCYSMQFKELDETGCQDVTCCFTWCESDPRKSSSTTYVSYGLTDGLCRCVQTCSSWLQDTTAISLVTAGNMPTTKTVLTVDVNTCLQVTGSSNEWVKYACGTGFTVTEDVYSDASCSSQPQQKVFNMQEMCTANLKVESSTMGSLDITGCSAQGVEYKSCEQLPVGTSPGQGHSTSSAGALVAFIGLLAGFMSL